MGKKKLVLDEGANMWLNMKAEMDFGLFMCELRVGGSEYGERLTGDGFLMGMDNGGIHE